MIGRQVLAGDVPPAAVPGSAGGRGRRDPSPVGAGGHDHEDPARL